MKKILITGGAGYIGSILVPKLLSKGFHVTVLDNLMFDQFTLTNCVGNSNFEFVKSDVRNEVAVSENIKDKDIIIPLAALVGAPLCNANPSDTKTINRDASLLLNDLRNENQWMIFPTTNSGYGVGEEGKFCTEETPLNPISSYGKYKVEVEKEILNSKNGITLRLATVFGASPRMRMDLLVNDFTYQAFKNRSIVLFESHFKRNFIHVQDVSRAFMHCIENFDKMKNQPYNVGLSSANMSKMDLCKKIKEFVPSFEIYESEHGEDPDKRDYIVSNDKIEATGYTPKYNLDYGIPELLKLYKLMKTYQHGNI